MPRLPGRARLDALGATCMLTLIFAWPLCPGASASESLAVRWDCPKWITPYAPYRITVSLSNAPTGAAVVCRYEASDTYRGSVRGARMESASARFRFDLPPIEGNTSSEATFRIAVSRPGHPGAAVLSDTRSVPISDVVEHEFTGEAQVVIVKSLIPKRIEAHFNPCCNIVGGELITELIPVNPMEHDEGLPDRIASPFVRTEPDALTAATSGLYLQFRYPPRGDGNLDPETYRVYGWRDGQWKPVFDPVIDPKRRTITFACPDGGTFVLGGSARR